MPKEQPDMTRSEPNLSYPNQETQYENYQLREWWKNLEITNQQLSHHISQLRQNRKVVSVPLNVPSRKTNKVQTNQPPTYSIDVPETPRPEYKRDSRVFDLRSESIQETTIMTKLGLDIGTRNIVLSFESGDGNIDYIREVNGYYKFERPSKFVENMLNDQTKIRSDGTKRAARWIKLPGSDSIIVLGADAEELAYAHNDTLLRPMASGGVTAEDESMTVLASIIHGMLDMAEHELGSFDNKVDLCYCTTAQAVNGDNNIDYHKKVVETILGGYETKAKLQVNSIVESHAIVIKEAPDGTGIGISWGAGTCTTSFVVAGMPVYNFSVIGSGDWIDSEVAKRHGYDPESRKRSKETPTTVSRRKEKIDLTITTNDRLDLDIILHYQILVARVVQGIIDGFKQNESQARIDRAINIYMAGGTCSPTGFGSLVGKSFAELGCPFEIGSVSKSVNPLYTVAEGCLIAARMQ